MFAELEIMKVFLTSSLLHGDRLKSPCRPRATVEGYVVMEYDVHDVGLYHDLGWDFKYTGYSKTPHM